MEYKTIRERLMDYFALRPRQHVTLDDLMDATGLSTVQVQNNISMIIREHNLGHLNFDITRVTAGQVWMYTPSDPKSDNFVAGEYDNDVMSDRRKFEELTVTKRGAIIIQDGEGNLFKATELEI